MGLERLVSLKSRYLQCLVMSMLILLISRMVFGFIWIYLVSFSQSSVIQILATLSYCHANSIGGKLVAGNQSGRHCSVQPDAHLDDPFSENLCWAMEIETTWTGNIGQLWRKLCGGVCLCILQTWSAKEVLWSDRHQAYQDPTSFRHYCQPLHHRDPNTFHCNSVLTSD